MNEQLPKYIKKALEEKKLPTKGIHHMAVFHDHWCELYQGRSNDCNCNPDVQIMPEKGSQH